MLSYEQYPEEKSRLWLSSFQKKISPLQHVSNDIQVYQCICRGFRIAQIPMKEGVALGIWMICTRFEVYVCSYVE